MFKFFVFHYHAEPVKIFELICLFQVRDSVVRREQAELSILVGLARIGIDDIGNVYTVIPIVVRTGDVYVYRLDILYPVELGIPSRPAYRSETQEILHARNIASSNGYVSPPDVIHVMFFALRAIIRFTKLSGIAILIC